jgi:hypothetical protein
VALTRLSLAAVDMPDAVFVPDSLAHELAHAVTNHACAKVPLKMLRPSALSARATA